MVRDAKSHEEAIARIQDLQDPNSNDRRAIRNRMSHVRSIDPEMADMLDGHVQKIADFLAARAGVPTTQPQPGAPIFDRFKQPAHAKGDTERLRRYARAAENPLGVMERIKGGDVSKEDVETLRELYPRMFARLQSRLLHGLTEMKSRPNYETRRAMEVLLGAPVDGASRPEAIKAIQQQIANRVVPEVAAAEMGSPSQGGTVTPGNARPPEIAGAYATRNQQILWGAQ